MTTLRRLIPLPVLSVTIFALWLFLAQNIGIGQVILATALAVGVPWLTRGFWPDPAPVRRPWAGVRLLAVVLGDIVLANWAVARRVVGPLDRLRPAFLEVPLDLTDHFVATILGSIVSLTPGTVSVEIDPDRAVLLVHVLDAPDTAAVVADIKRRYEAPLKEIFAC
jgi:multicomponent K+:H+ antiporter subunit E